MLTGYSLEHPSLPRLWAQAGYAYDSAEDPDHSDNALRGIAKMVVNKPGAEADPGVHDLDLGDNVTVVTEPEPSTGGAE
eukprot:7848776-Karenia_brevis.AAC.1